MGKKACNTFVCRWDHETCATCGVEHAFDSMGSRVEATVESGDAKGLAVATLEARLRDLISVTAQN